MFKSNRKILAKLTLLIILGTGLFSVGTDAQPSYCRPYECPLCPIGFSCDLSTCFCVCDCPNPDGSCPGFCG